MTDSNFPFFAVNGIVSLGNSSIDCQRFVDAFVSVFAYDWSNRLSNFKNVVETPFEPAFERRVMIGFC